MILDTIKTTGCIINDVAISPIVNIINPTGLIPMRIRELSKVLSNLSFNFLSLLASGSGLKTWSSWIKVSESLSLCISSPESRQLCGEVNNIVDSIFDLLNTKESKKCINQMSSVCCKFIDVIKSDNFKNIITDFSIHTINTIELMNSVEGRKMRKEFYYKLNNALSEEYSSFTKIEKEPEKINNLENSRIVYHKKKEFSLIPSIIIMYFCFYGVFSFIKVYI